MKRSIVALACVFVLAGSARAEDGGLIVDPLGARNVIQSQPVSACAAEVPHDTPLTLADVVTHALCNNPQTHESWARVLAQAAALGESRSAYLPTVNGDAPLGYAHAHGDALGASFTGTEASPSLSLSYLLLDLGGRDASVESTKQGLIAADYTHNATLQNVLFAAVQAYYQLYSAQGAVAAADENVKSTQASLDAASARHKVGAATIADQLQAETTQAQAVLAKAQAENQAQINKGALANVMGLDPNYTFTITTEPSKELTVDFGDDVGKLLEQAKAARPDLAAAGAQLASARANLSVQQSAGLPSLTASAGREQDYALSGRNGNGNSSSIGVTLHVPFFTGFDNSYQIEQARENMVVQEAVLRDTQNSILLDVWRTYSNFQTAKETLSMTDALLTSADKSNQVALGRYKAGAGSITDLLNAQAALASARQQQVQSQYNWLIAKVDMLRALGKLDKTAIPEQQSPPPPAPVPPSEQLPVEKPKQP